ncbi:MAG: response regulator [Spartobacteria bacterium]
MNSTPKLLCVDDSQLVQSLVARELESYEVELHFASDGAAGLECCLREMPDLVMLDLRMPVMNGIEFLKKWKAELGFADTRFIIMTSETARDIVQEVLSFGISDYIAKPFSGKTLVGRLSQHVLLRRRASAAPAPQTPAPASAPVKQVAAPPPEWNLRSIPVLTRKMEAGQSELPEEEHSLQDVIAKYQVLMGSGNAHLTSVLAELLKEGKVFVESEKFSERIQLKYENIKFDSTAAASLLARYFEEQRLEKQGDSGATQRIVLHRPSIKPRSTK